MIAELQLEGTVASDDGEARRLLLGVLMTGPLRIPLLNLQIRVSFASRRQKHENIYEVMGWIRFMCDFKSCGNECSKLLTVVYPVSVCSNVAKFASSISSAFDTGT